MAAPPIEIRGRRLTAKVKFNTSQVFRLLLEEACINLTGALDEAAFAHGKSYVMSVAM